jgi:hypothetical protein
MSENGKKVHKTRSYRYRQLFIMSYTKKPKLHLRHVVTPHITETLIKVISSQLDSNTIVNPEPEV